MRYLLMSGMLVVAVAFTGCSKKEPSASDSASVVSLDAKYTEALVGHWKAVNSVTQTESGGPYIFLVALQAVQEKWNLLPPAFRMI